MAFFSRNSKYSSPGAGPSGTRRQVTATTKAAKSGDFRDTPSSGSASFEGWGVSRESEPRQQTTVATSMATPGNSKRHSSSSSALLAELLAIEDNQTTFLNTPKRKPGEFMKTASTGNDTATGPTPSQSNQLTFLDAPRRRPGEFKTTASSSSVTNTESQASQSNQFTVQNAPRCTPGTFKSTSSASNENAVAIPGLSTNDRIQREPVSGVRDSVWSNSPVHDPVWPHDPMIGVRWELTVVLYEAAQKNVGWTLDLSMCRKDLGDERPKWILSTYGATKNTPASLFEGNEYSPEEVRWRFYDMASQGQEAQADQEAIQLWSKADQDMKDALNRVNDLQKFMDDAEKKHPNRYDFMNWDGTRTKEEMAQAIESTHQAVKPSGFGAGNSFGQPSASSNPFSKPAAATFGQATGSSAFGSSPFGKAAPNSAFGQPATSSAFGQPAFGQSGAGSSTSGSAFGQPATSSPFGQPASGSAFGKPAFGQSANTASPFGQALQTPAFGTSPFGQPTQSASPFGQASQPAQSASPFGQTGQSAPAFGQPSQPATAFGQPSQPGFGQSPFGQGQSNSGFGQSPFGQAAKPAFGQSTEPAQSSPFGAGTTNAGGFVQNSTSPFGAGTTNAGGFGQDSTSPFGAGTTNAGGFGQNVARDASPFGSQPATSAAPEVSMDAEQPSGFSQQSATTHSNPFSVLNTSQAAPTTQSSPFSIKAAASSSDTSSRPPPQLLTDKAPIPLHYNQTLPNTESRKGMNGNLSTYKGQPVQYIEDATAATVSTASVPVYSRPDGKGLEKVWFPDAGATQEVAALNGDAKVGEKIGDVLASSREMYRDGVVEAYRNLALTGRFEAGKMPGVPPMREWTSYDF